VINGWNWTSTPSRADLGMVNADGTGKVGMTSANGDERRNFHPIFSPVVQGGYFWVVFTSLRTYGNRLTNTPDYDYTHCVNSNWSDCRSRQLCRSHRRELTEWNRPESPGILVARTGREPAKLRRVLGARSVQEDGRHVRAGIRMLPRHVPLRERQEDVWQTHGLWNRRRHVHDGQRLLRWWFVRWWGVQRQSQLTLLDSHWSSSSV